MRLAEALRENLTTKDSKQAAVIIPELSSMANSFGNHDKEITEAVMCDETAKANFAMVAAACMTALGYTGKCEDTRGGHWDERNKASTKYCKDHFGEFAKMFQDLTGFQMQFREDSHYQYFEHDCLLGRLDTRGMQIAAETSSFLREHPTLQQKMVGTFLRIISENDLYPGIEAEGFPFI